MDHLKTGKGALLSWAFREEEKKQIVDAAVLALNRYYEGREKRRYLKGRAC